jgi:hypothetical protein
MVNEPVCVCGLCWSFSHEDDPQAWPTIAPPRTWFEGTIRVALPCTIAIGYPMGGAIEVESECEFFGHTLSEALAKAAQHRRDGVKYCPVAAKHAEDFVLPEGCSAE